MSAGQEANSGCDSVHSTTTVEADGSIRIRSGSETGRFPSFCSAMSAKGHWLMHTSGPPMTFRNAGFAWQKDRNGFSPRLPRMIQKANGTDMHAHRLYITVKRFQNSFSASGSCFTIGGVTSRRI
jgi:hypothetical protein